MITDKAFGNFALESGQSSRSPNKQENLDGLEDARSPTKVSRGTKMMASTPKKSPSKAEKDKIPRGVARTISDDSFGWQSSELYWDEDSFDDGADAHEKEMFKATTPVKPMTVKVSSQDEDWFSEVESDVETSLKKKKSPKDSDDDFFGTTDSSFSKPSKVAATKSDMDWFNKSEQKPKKVDADDFFSSNESVFKRPANLEATKSDMNWFQSGTREEKQTFQPQTSHIEENVHSHSSSEDSHEDDRRDHHRRRSSRKEDGSKNESSPDQQKRRSSSMKEHKDLERRRSSKSTDGDAGRRSLKEQQSNHEEALDVKSRIRRSVANAASDEMDTSRRGRRSSVATGSAERERDDLSVSRRGASRRHTLAVGKSTGSVSDDSGERGRSTKSRSELDGSRHRIRRASVSRGASVTRGGDPEEGTRSRSHSRRRASSRSRKSLVHCSSMLGKSDSDSEPDDGDIESIFKKAQKEERRAMLDKSRKGPIRALKRDDKIDTSTRHLEELVKAEEEAAKKAAEASAEKKKKGKSLDDLLRFDRQDPGHISCAASVQPDGRAPGRKKSYISSSSSVHGDMLDRKPLSKPTQPHRTLNASTDNWTYAVDELLSRRHKTSAGAESPRSHKAQLATTATIPTLKEPKKAPSRPRQTSRSGKSAAVNV